MKLLLATDGSPSSDAAVEAVARRPWPPGTEIEVVTVVHVRLPFAPDPALITASVYIDQLEKAAKRAPEIVESAAARVAGEQRSVTTQVLKGPPKLMIVQEAERIGADLIVVGSHGYGATRRFLLGSVAMAVALHAPCSVEIVRARPAPAAAA